MVYQEVFSEHTYSKYNIKLGQGDVVIDIGANIGLASIYLALHYPGIRLFSFEPIPEVYNLLSKNMELYGFDAMTFNCGISNVNGKVPFNYYPNSTVLSGSYGNLEEERGNVFSYLQKEAAHQGLGASVDQLEKIVEERVYSEEIQCEMIRLSDFITQSAITQIDLLKIDAEKAEFNVLEGINEDHWKMIKQVVMEVHNQNDRLREIEELLQAKGFKVIYEQDAVLIDTNIFNVYGIKETGNSKLLADKSWDSNMYWSINLFKKSIQDHLLKHLPDYMIPESLHVIHEMPLNKNGKIDKGRLLEIIKKESETNTELFEHAVNDIESMLMEIWQSVLKKDRISVHDSFFDLGGNSLVAVKVIKLINDAFPNKVEVADLFMYNNIKQLAKLIGNASENSNDPEFTGIEL
jgi:FkbM family methyltransferase